MSSTLGSTPPSTIYSSRCSTMPSTLCSTPSPMCCAYLKGLRLIGCAITLGS
jgi:hypothetical protein